MKILILEKLIDTKDILIIYKINHKFIKSNWFEKYLFRIEDINYYYFYIKLFDNTFRYFESNDQEKLNRIRNKIIEYYNSDKIEIPKIEFE